MYLRSAQVKHRHAIGGHPVPLDGETSDEDSSSDEERSGVQSPFNFTSRDTFDQTDNVSFSLISFYFKKKHVCKKTVCKIFKNYKRNVFILCLFNNLNCIEDNRDRILFF